MRNRRAFVRKLLVGVAALSLGACSDSSGPDGLGTIIGRVTAPDLATAIPGASVYLEERGPSSAILSDFRGDYRIEDVTAGSHVVIAEKGNFRSSITVIVPAGRTMMADNLGLTALGKLAYVDGSFDSIEHIIQKLGYTVDQLQIADLSQPAKLAQYRMIFLNCGANVPESAAATLLAWVHAGGTLYASDWELDIVQAMFPSDIMQYGSAPQQDVTGTVLDTKLQQSVGKNQVLIAYDLGGWKTLSQLSNMPTVLVRGPVTTDNGAKQDQAMAIAFAYGSGEVVYTTFHNEAGVTADQILVLRHFIYY